MVVPCSVLKRVSRRSALAVCVALSLGWLGLQGTSVGPILVGVAPAAGQAPPAAAQAPADEAPTVRDLQLRLQARAALMKERAFAAPDFGVVVHQRVATLWGTVPSVELARRAEELVHQVPGLVEVHNELQVVPSDQAMTRSFAPPSPERSGGAESALGGPFQAPAALVGRPTEHGPAPGRGLPWRPGRLMTAMAPAAAPTQMPREGSTMAGQGNPPSPPPPLGTNAGWRPKRTTGVETSSIASRSQAPAAVLLPPVRPESSLPIAAAVEALRRKEERFRPIRPRVHGAQVYLHGTGSRWQDLFDFAKAVSLLPGVERVILQDVHAEPSTTAGPR